MAEGQKLVRSITVILGERYRELFLMAVLLFCTFTMVSLVGFNPDDPTLLHPGTGKVTNPGGPVGALLADFLFGFIGVGAWGTFFVMVASVLAMAGRPVLKFGQTVVAGLGAVSMLGLVHIGFRPGLNYPPGGTLGKIGAEGLEEAVGTVGAVLTLGGVVIGSVTLLFQIRWGVVARRVVELVEARLPFVQELMQQAASRASAVAAQGAQGAAVVASNGARNAAGAAVVGARGVAGVAAQQARGAGGWTWSVFRRMGQAFTRTDVDEDATWDSFLDEGDPSAITPDEVQATALEAGSIHLAEVEWEPTEETAKSSIVLDMFPDLSPRNVQRRPDQVLAEPGPQDPPSGSGDSWSRAPLSGATQPGQEARGLDTAVERAPVRHGDTVAEEATPLPQQPRVAMAPSAPAAARVEPMEARVELPSPVAAVSAPRSEAVPPPGVMDHALSEADLDAPEPAALSRPARASIGAQVKASPHIHQTVADDGEALVAPKWGSFQLPKLKLLDVVPPQQVRFDQEELRALANNVEETASNFKVTGQVTNVQVGPVVTTFEFVPDAGIPVRKVAGLSDDLAMALRARSVRILAPIPGRGACGIEIPSPQRLTIFFRELLADKAFRESKAVLPVVLGKDVDGRPVVADIVKMPHVLVAGTTGAGKSVGVNGMLMSLMFTKTPDELRLLLIDPKQLEFKMYDDLPHLLHPVITEPKLAGAALEWACREMDDRYALLAAWDTRNILSYNEKVEREAQDWSAEKARKYAPKGWPEDVAPPPPKKLPFIVIVIDELADLMMVAKKEIEHSIVRLAQKARACGIHLVLATQRPSADVVTGLIKANMPTRMAYKLRSGLDSRVILDENGAEKLLGRGDMLYLANDGSTDLKRVHGAFVSDEEVGRVCEHLKAQGAPQYIDAVTATPDVDSIAEEDRDPLYHEAVEVVVAAGKASTSMVQRHLKIGYNRAARIIDQMEAAGVIGPADGARPREVLISDAAY